MQQTLTHMWSIAGWTMLHYVWTGLAFTGVAWLGRLLLQRASSRVRYLYAVACFTCLALAPIAVAVLVAPHIPLQPPAQQPLAAALDTSPIELLDLENAADDFPADVFSANEGFMPQEISADAAILEQSLPATAQVTFLLDRLAYWAPAIWLVGFPLACGWLFTGLLGAERLRRRSRLLSDGPIIAACQRLADAIKIRRAPCVGVCEQIARPILIGILRPIILLPPAALAGWTAEQMEVVLLHELAHIRRRDNLISLLQRIAEAVLFFQPGIWWVSGWIRLEREHCCDEAVVRQTRNARFYAETLAFIAGLTQPQAANAAPSVWQAHTASGMAQNHLVTRIRRILHKEQNMKPPMFDMLASRRWGFSLMFLFAAALFVAGAWGPLTGREENVALAEAGRGDEPAAKAEKKPAEETAPVKENDALGLEFGGGAADAARLGIVGGGIGNGGETVGSAKERLRYDGKSFAVWNSEWETELNPARRVIAIEAFTAFAKNGYGEEAARAIFNVIRQYDTRVIIGSTPEGKLKSTAINAFNKIERKYWTPLITQALQSEDRKEVTFALQVVFKNREFVKSSLPLLLTLMRGKDPQIAAMAINAVQFINPRPAELQKTLRQLVLSKQAEVVRGAAGALAALANRGDGGFGAGDANFIGPRRYAGNAGGSGGMSGMRGAAGGMRGMAGGMRSAAGMGGMSGGMGGMAGGMRGAAGMREMSGIRLISPRGEYFPELVEALKTADSNTAGSIGYALSLLSPKGELATPALIELLKQKEPAKSNALWAFINLPSLAAEALPAILPLLNDENKYVRFNAMKAVKAAIDSQPRVGSAVDTQIIEFYGKLAPPALAAIRDVLSEAQRGDSRIRVAAEALWDRLPREKKK